MKRRSSTALRAPARDIYQDITDRIVAAIEASATEMRMPWHRTGLSSVIPTNANTGNDYNGINVVALMAESQLCGYQHPIFATYKQWQSLGAQVRKGEKSSLVVFYKTYEVEPDPEKDGDDGQRRVAKASHVFNCAQVDGYELPEAPPPLPPIERHEQADLVIEATGADIRIGGESAFYRPSTDHIQMPAENLFQEPASSQRREDWYGVLFHELGHWSGADKRLKREFGKRFSDQAYCVEEMVAELNSCFAMARLGMIAQPRPDHAHYVEHYLRLMKADNRAIFAAAAKAAEATNYIFAFSDKDEPPTLAEPEETPHGYAYPESGDRER